MRSFIKGLITVSLLVTSLMAKDTKVAEKKAQTTQSVQDVQVFVSDNKDGKITPATIEKAFEKKGFYITANNNMNSPFTKRYKKTGYDVFNLYVVHKPDLALALIKKYPQMALFTPLSMSIYTKKGDKTISVSSMTLHGISKITNIPEDDKDLIKLSQEVKEALKAAMPNGKFETLNYNIKKPDAPLVAKFEMQMDVKPKELEDEKEDLQAEIEGELESQGFVVAGFNTLGEDFKEKGYDAYDFFDVYSICKIAVAYTVSKTHPNMGAFAPCSFYMYKKKGDKTVHFGWASVVNWISSLDIEDKESKESLLNAQKKFEDILKEATED